MYLWLALLPVVAGCEKEGVWAKEPTTKGSPPCIERKIQEMANAPVANPPARVYSYRYKGQTVYYIPAKCCDIPSLLVDAQCNTICSPDGGLSGQGDGRCPDFFNSRTEETLIWEDPRPR
jgi:hypothetical protein